MLSLERSFLKSKLRKLLLENQGLTDKEQPTVAAKDKSTLLLLRFQRCAFAQLQRRGLQLSVGMVEDHGWVETSSSK